MTEESFASSGTNHQLVFLIGCFRSGTSLLHRLISKHPDIALMWECDAMKFLPPSIPDDWTQRLNLWNGAIERHDIDTSTLPSRGSREEAAIALYRQYGNSRNARVIGEKSPYYADVIRRLAHRFPLARFIILTRDPSNVLDSVQRAGGHNRFFGKPWMPLRVLKEAGRVRRDLRWLERKGYSHLHLRFETLISNPSRACESIWRFLGLPAITDQAVQPIVDSIPEGPHHNNAVFADVDPTRAHNLLDPRSDSYRSLWANRFLTDPPSTQPAPGPLRLLRDEAAFQSCRAFDLSARLAFTRAPLGLLERHRFRSKHSVGKAKCHQAINVN